MMPIVSKPHVTSVEWLSSRGDDCTRLMIGFIVVVLEPFFHCAMVNVFVRLVMGHTVVGLLLIQDKHWHLSCHPGRHPGHTVKIESGTTRLSLVEISLLADMFSFHYYSFCLGNRVGEALRPYNWNYCPGQCLCVWKCFWLRYSNETRQ